MSHDPYEVLRAMRALIHRAEVRLVHVVVPEVSRASANGLIQLCRALDENAWDICPLPQPHDPGPDGWLARAEWSLVKRSGIAKFFGQNAELANSALENANGGNLSSTSISIAGIRY